MNILEAEDVIKGLPDQVLFQYAQNPPPNIPQFLAVSEVQRRQEMRQRFQSQQEQPQQTVKDQILQGIGGTGMAPEVSNAPPMAPPQPPVGMANGGQIPGAIPDSAWPVVKEMMGPAQLQNFAQQNFGTVPGLARLGANVLGTALGGPLGGYAAGRLSENFLPMGMSNLQNTGFEAGRWGAGGNLFGTAQTPFEMAARDQQYYEPLSGDNVPFYDEEEMADGGLTPGGIVYMQAGRTVPASSDPLSTMLGRIPGVFQTVRGLMPAPAGMSMADLEKFRPTREQYLDPESEARRAALLAQLEQMGTSRRTEDIAAAERYLKEAETPIQAAQDEARQAAISSTLMRLGAGLAAGRPEEGLASAAQGVEQTMGRARELAAAERRAARQDYRSAEREAVRAQRAAADQAFAMQAQNITNDENKQREFVRDQNQFAQWAFTQQREAGRDQNQAFNNALQLSIGLTQAVDTAVREATREKNLNERQYASTFSSIFKEVLAEVKSADFGTDEEGNAIVPTPEQLISTARQKTVDALESAGIYSPSSVVSVNTPEELQSLSKGQRYRGPDGVVRIKP